MCYDALDRKESCGAHFSEEYQTPQGEAQRNDAEYAFVSAYEYKGNQGTTRIAQGAPCFRTMLSLKKEVINKIRQRIMNLKLKIWRQKDAISKGAFKDYTLNDVSPQMSFLEMLDYLNKQVIESGEDAIHYEYDCSEGICGSCGLYINGRPHGPKTHTTTCELRMRDFQDGSTIVIEPWRSKAFPVIKDLTVDRSAFDRIMLAGGFVNVNTGTAQDANTIPINKKSPTEHLMLPYVLVAGHVWLHAKTHQLHVSLSQSSSVCIDATGQSGSN
jgi:hypothetical protein